jgi:hypothetical protein
MGNHTAKEKQITKMETLMQEASRTIRKTEEECICMQTAKCTKDNTRITFVMDKG